MIARPHWLVWAAAGGLAASAMGGYVLTRALPGGFLGDHGDVGNWRCPLGIAALSVETLIILLACSPPLAGAGPCRERGRDAPACCTARARVQPVPLTTRCQTRGTRQALPGSRGHPEGALNAHVPAWPAGQATRPRGGDGCCPGRSRPVFVTLLALPRGAAPGTALSYTRFLADVGAGTVRAVTIGPAGQVTGILAGGQPFTTTIPVALGGNGLAGDLAAHHVQVTATAADALLAAVGADRAAAAAADRRPAVFRVPQRPPAGRRPRRDGRPERADQGEGAGHRRRAARHPVHRRGWLPRR